MSSSTTKNAGYKNMPEVKPWKIPILNSKERKEFLKNLELSSEFDMSYRGLVLYYGKEFIAYKKENPTDPNRNEFLRVFSKYMTDYLEDTCPSSWKECDPAFWEEMIFAFYPLHLQITKTQKEAESFLSQLQKFAHWLDKRVGTTHSPIIKNYSAEIAPDLKSCELLLNTLFLKHFPRAHHKDWNIESDMEKVEREFEQCLESWDSVFHVTSIIGNIVVFTEFNSNKTYYIKEMPIELVNFGMIISGVIGRKKGEKHWKLLQPESIYPQRAEKYIQFIYGI